MRSLATLCLDVAVGLWILFVGALFVAPVLIVCMESTRALAEVAELQAVGRYVYVVVVATGLIGLATRAARRLTR